MDGYLAMDAPRSESAVLDELRDIAAKNKVYRSFIGMGYYGTITPPSSSATCWRTRWYTAYTPYQPEISQGRLEALINFQTMVTDPAGLEIANSSLLDEATAAAEAMTLSPSRSAAQRHANVFLSPTRFIHRPLPSCAPARTLRFRSSSATAPIRRFAEPTFRRPQQYPATNGDIRDYALLPKGPRGRGSSIAATDLLSLVMLTPPGEYGVPTWPGNSQRWRADGLWRAACRFSPPRTSTSASCPAVWSACRSTPPATGLPADADYARINKHPPREGDQQYLHGPGTAGRHGLDVCRLSRPCPG